jgi:signal transduction histidine kinase
MINTILRQNASLVDHKKLKVTSKLSFNPPFRAHRRAFNTALTNVIDNAIKFTPEKGELIVDLHSEEACHEINITNTCKELRQDDLTKIFEPFRRVEGSKAPGSGLGLAITKKIIEKHGGTIEALNVEKGLKIRIRLPI